MTREKLDQVRALDATLKTRGQLISANKVVQHLGGSKRDALKLLRLFRAETQAQPPAPVPSVEPAAAPWQQPYRPAPVAAAPPVVAPPVPLLAKAEADLKAALVAERAARRRYDLATTVAERDQAQPVWLAARRQREQAATQVEKLERSRTILHQAIPGARIDARRAAGECAVLEEETRRSLLRARRQAQQAQEELARLTNDLLTIAGPEAVPAEQP